jgi:gas vesicle protein
MAQIISSANKEKMLTGIREKSQGFRKDLDLTQQELIDVAKKAKFFRLDIVTNASSGLISGILDSVDELDSMLDQVAELYLKQGVLSEAESVPFKKFADSKISLTQEYDKVTSPEGEQAYSAEEHGVQFRDTLKKMADLRLAYLEGIAQDYKLCAGEDIADTLVGAMKKIEERCNEFVTEIKSTLDEQSAVDDKLNAIKAGIGDLIDGLKMNSVAEKKTAFGSVASSNYVGDI